MVVTTCLAGLVLVMVAGPLTPGPLEEMGVDNPFGLAGPEGNHGEDAKEYGWISSLVFPALLCPPVAVAVAVLRYRLYDLDLIISRTLTWALLTVLLGLGYAAVVLGLSRLAGQGSSLVVAAATLAVVAAFSPLRRRVHGVSS